MSSFRTALRTAILTATLAGGALTALAGESHADVPGLTYFSNLYCTGEIIDVVTFFNSSGAPISASATLVSSLQSTKKSVVAPANSTIDVMFTLTQGERIDKIVFRDADDVIQYTMIAGTVVTGSGGCVRPAFDLLELVGYSLTCNDGVTHATVSIENSGDYSAELTASADAWFADAPTYSDALQQGLIFADAETLLATPGATRVFNLDFKIVDQFELAVRKGSTDVFVDGPRAMAVGEGCATAPDVTESTTTSTTAATTTTIAAPDTTDAAPDTTEPAPDTTDGFENESQAPGTSTTTIVPATTVVAQYGRSLPVTGRGSLPVGFIAALLLAGGLALVRTTRRSPR